VSHRYHVDVFWSDEDHCWIANAPDLRPCSAHGDTPVAAVTEIEAAINIILDHYREQGMPAPAPIYRSAASLGRRAVLAPPADATT
jgi:predicted RNase H-like HicB family nuclease